MSDQIKDICNILKNLASASAHDLKLSNGTVVKSKNLSTSQLREFIKTMSDSPLTQALFNTAATKVFKESIIDLPADYNPTIYDRLLFLIETRIRSIDSIATLVNSDNASVKIDLNQLQNTLHEIFVQNPETFASKTVTDNTISLTIGTPTLDTELRLNEEVYKDYKTNTETNTELKQLLADFFIYELAKYISSMSVASGTVVNFSDLTFKDRVELIQTLPVTLIQHVIDYVEKQKTLIDAPFLVDGMYLAIDSSFFALY
jgi:hypothetical protein